MELCQPHIFAYIGVGRKGACKMDAGDINARMGMRRKEVHQINRQCKEEYERYGGIEFLTKYIMSELISPIEDYENVISIIRNNYYSQISGEILLIGAYLNIQWSSSDNEILQILHSMYPYLPSKEKAIVNYLNAHQIFIKDKDYRRNERYKTELEKSIEYDVKFVNNHIKMAGLLCEEGARAHYTVALANVVEIFDEATETDWSFLLTPQSFIGEFILGTRTSASHYKYIAERCRCAL